MELELEFWILGISAPMIEARIHQLREYDAKRNKKSYVIFLGETLLPWVSVRELTKDQKEYLESPQTPYPADRGI